MNDGSHIVLVSKEGNENVIFVLNPDGSEPVRITKPGTNPTIVIPTYDNEVVYWLNYQCENGVQYCYQFRKTNLDGSDEEVVWENVRWPVVASHQINQFIFPLTDKIFSLMDKMYAANLDLSNKIEIGDSSCTWCYYLSPDGNKLLRVTHRESSDPEVSNSWVASLRTFEPDTVIELPQQFDVSTHLPEYKFDAAWSPDSRLLLLTGNFTPIIIDVETMEVIIVLPDSFKKAQFFHWVP